jgi:hypothetical protein
MAGPVYVAFDGDKDRRYYDIMAAWSAHKNIEFKFEDAHDLDEMTSRAQNEDYVKANLRARMKASTALVLLVGDSTRFLRKFVLWEIEFAQSLQLPIIVVNLNGTNEIDDARCPGMLKKKGAVHIPFKLTAIKHALSNWPGYFAGLSAAERLANFSYGGTWD